MTKSPTPRAPKLDSLIRCRRELARLYAETRGGLIDPRDATRMASIIGLIAKIVEGSEIEARIEALEAAQRSGSR